MQAKLKGFMQIGILVKDINEAVKNWEKMGVGPWEISEMRNDVPPFTDLTFDGQELEKGVVMITAMCSCYGFEIELIQPVMDTQYKKWLDEHGNGIHHLAFDMGEGYEQVLIDHKKESGKDPWVRGKAINGMMDFSYLDLRDEMGIIMECYKNLRPGKPVLDIDVEPKLTK